MYFVISVSLPYRYVTFFQFIFPLDLSLRFVPIFFVPLLSPFVPFCPLLSPGDNFVPWGQFCPLGTILSPGDKRGQRGTKGGQKGTNSNMGTNLRDKSKGKINWKNVTYRYGRLTDIKKYIHIIMHSLIYARKKGINLIGGGGSSNFYHGGRLTFQSRQLFKKEHYQR